MSHSYHSISDFGREMDILIDSNLAKKNKLTTYPLLERDFEHYRGLFPGVRKIINNVFEEVNIIFDDQNIIFDYGTMTVYVFFSKKESGFNCDKNICSGNESETNKVVVEYVFINNKYTDEYKSILNRLKNKLMDFRKYHLC